VTRVEESHKGHTIVIEEPEGGGERQAFEEEAQEEPRVTIDEQPVNVIRNSDGTYSSEGLFYAKYTSLLELARASIDAHLPEG
jgi:Tyrosinase co-factor MelC1